jgi:GTPase
MAEKLGASLTILRERIITNNNCLNSKINNKNAQNCRKAIEILVRKVPDDQQTIELRIAVLGNAQEGKSTLLGIHFQYILIICLYYQLIKNKFLKKIFLNFFFEKAF